MARIENVRLGLQITNQPCFKMYKRSDYKSFWAADYLIHIKFGYMLSACHLPEWMALQIGDVS